MIPLKGRRERPKPLSTRRLSYRVWDDGWDMRLNLPAVAMLLIALSQKDGLEVNHGLFADWYAISPDAISRGLKAVVNALGG